VDPWGQYAKEEREELKSTARLASRYVDLPTRVAMQEVAETDADERDLEEEEELAQKKAEEEAEDNAALVVEVRDHRH